MLKLSNRFNPRYVSFYARPVSGMYIVHILYRIVLSVYILYRIVLSVHSRTPAFGVISLAPRGRGAFGAPVRMPAAPIWRTAAFGGGERKINN